MSQKILDTINKCSKQTKITIGKFLKELLPQQQYQQYSNDCLKLQQVFKSITDSFTIAKARQVSKNQRNAKKLDNHQFNYGEITFKSIYQTIHKINNFKILGKEEYFYDLGSGSGKVLFAASLCHSFKKCIGIQVLESLHQSSLKLKTRIQQNKNQIKNMLQNIYGYQYQFPDIITYNNDFNNVDWSQGTIIFVSSTCYSHQIMNDIKIISQKMKKGTIFVTLTIQLDQKQQYWKVLEKFQGETSWGKTTIYIQIKISQQ